MYLSRSGIFIFQREKHNECTTPYSYTGPSVFDVLCSICTRGMCFNQLVANPYHLDEPTFIFRGNGNYILFLFLFSMKFTSANKIAQDGTPRSAASHLGQLCLPISHIKDARLIWVNHIQHAVLQKILIFAVIFPFKMIISFSHCPCAEMNRILSFTKQKCHQC